MHYDAKIHMRVYCPNPRIRKSFHWGMFLLCWDHEDKRRIAKPGGMMRKSHSGRSDNLCKSPEEKQRRENQRN